VVQQERFLAVWRHAGETFETAREMVERRVWCERVIENRQFLARDDAPENRVHDVLVEEEKRIFRTPGSPERPTGVDEGYRLVEESEERAARVERKHHAPCVDIRLLSYRRQTELGFPTGTESLWKRICESDNLSRLAFPEERLERPGDDDVTIEEQHRLCRMREWRLRSHEKRKRELLFRNRRIGGNERGLAGENRFLIVVEPAVQNEHRLGIPDEAQRVDQGDCTDVVA
jgi:hypothetical protein